MTDFNSTPVVNKYESYFETLNKLFITPFTEQLIDLYPEKTLLNKDKVIIFMEMAKGTTLYFNLVKQIDPTVQNSKRDQTITTIEGLWKIYNGKVELKMFKEQPTNWNIVGFCEKKSMEIINKYYDSFDNKETVDIDKSTIPKIIDNLLNIIIKYNTNITVGKILSKRIVQLKSYLGINIEFKLARVNLQKSDFSGKDLRKKNINDWVVSGSKFIGTKFHGDGTTGTCIHWGKAENCDFTDAQFTGKICNKTSVYDGSNFTRVNLTPIFHNPPASMKNCDFTDAYIIDPNTGNKLMGKDLIKYLKNKYKWVTIDGYKYSLPDDGGYNSDELDKEIWKDL